MTKDASQSPDKQFILVDGSSYLYRAYHALPDLRGPTGLPTGAIYGMVTMLRRLRREYFANYGVCVFDAKGKTFRDELFAEYKAHRPALPTDLGLQIAPIHQLVKALGWPLLMVEGVEADDVIASLAKRASDINMKVVISTGDKDLAQLVDDNITLINTMSNEKLDRAGVIQKFGVAPEKIIDYLALIGDASDGIPGVAKVGPKTAAKWLQLYGSLDGVIAAAAEIKGVVGENLRQVINWLPTARTLLTVRYDCLPDIVLQRDVVHQTYNAPELTLNPEDKSLLQGLFETHGFKTWLNDLSNRELNNREFNNRELNSRVATSSRDDHLNKVSYPNEREENSALPVLADSGNYELITSWDRFDHWLKAIETAKLTAFDTETTSLNPLEAKIVGLSFAVESGKAAYLPVAHTLLESAAQLPREIVLDKLRHWIEGDQYPKLGQHLKYDAQVLANHGLQLAGVVHDTLLQSYVLESHKSHDLAGMMKRHLGLATISYESICGKGVNQINFSQVALADACRYASEDADATLQLHQALYPQIQANSGLNDIYHRIEMPLSRVLRIVERTGVLIDQKLLQVHSHELAQQLARLEKEAYELAGTAFNLNSPKQIGDIFFNRLGLPIVKKTAGGAPSTDDDVLQKLAANFPLPKRLLDYRALSKLKTTYTDKLPRMVNVNTGRVHTYYAQAVAVTGRLTSNEPNLQNIPIRTAEGRRVREAFIAAPGCQLVSADYSQIELRIMAHLSNDANLVQAFAKQTDVHRATASEIFSISPEAVDTDQRRVAKTINFGLIYGMSAFGLAASLGLTRDAAKLYIDRYFSRYPGVARYMEETRQCARRDGYVETVFGRRLWLPEINGGSGPRRQAAERAAINAPMQGTAADLIKLSMIAVQQWLEENACQARMIMQVHDELILEVPDSEVTLISQQLPLLMCNVAQLKVPLQADVGIGPNWDKAH